MRTGDLDGILNNFAENGVLRVADAPLVEGKDALRALYRGLLEMGQWNFTHDYSGADVMGELVILHGVARGTLAPPRGEVSSFANNFIHVWRKEPKSTPGSGR